MPHAREKALDLKAFGSALRRSSWPVLLATIIGGGATYGALSAMPAQYKAEARVLMDAAGAPSAPRGSAREATSILADEHAVLAQVEALRSQEIAEAVLRRPGLAARLVSAGEEGFPTIDSLLALAGLSERTDARPSAISAGRSAFDIYRRSLTVSPVPRSRVIAVEFQASDPQLAADVANAVAQAFAARGARADGGTGEDWLDREAQALRASVAAAEARVEEFRTRSGLAAAEDAASRLGHLTAELARAAADRAEVEARATSIRAALEEGGSLYSAGDVLNSPLFESLRETQRETRAHIADLSSFLPRRHPRIAVLSRQLDEIDGQIRGEAEKALSLLDTAVRAAEAREQTLAQSLEETKAAAARAAESSAELSALEREAKAQRDLLAPFLERYREAAAGLSADASSASGIVARALAPAEPFFPRPQTWSLAAAFCAFLLASAFAAARAFRSGGVLRPIDAPATISVPLRAARREDGARPAGKSAAASPSPAWNAAGRTGAAEAARQAGRTAPPPDRPAKPHRDIPASAKRPFAASGPAAAAQDRGTTPPPLRPFARETGERGSRDRTVGRTAPRPADIIPPVRTGGRASQRVTVTIESLGESYEKVTMVADDFSWPAERARPHPLTLDMPAAVAKGDDSPTGAMTPARQNLLPDQRGKAA